VPRHRSQLNADSEQLAAEIAENDAATAAVEAAAAEQQAELQAQIDKIEADEKERLAREMQNQEEDEGGLPDMPPMPSIVVKQPPPQPSAPVGGFEL